MQPIQQEAARVTIQPTDEPALPGEGRMSERTYFQPGVEMSERRNHPEFGISEDRARLLIRGAIDASLREHERQILVQIDSRFGELTEMIKSAFPDGDPHGHRRAHEQEIKDAAGWSRLKADLLSKILTGGVWAGVVWIMFAIIEAIKQEIKK